MAFGHLELLAALATSNPRSRPRMRPGPTGDPEVLGGVALGNLGFWRRSSVEAELRSDL